MMSCGPVVSGPAGGYQRTDQVWFANDATGTSPASKRAKTANWRCSVLSLPYGWLEVFDTAHRPADVTFTCPYGK